MYSMPLGSCSHFLVLANLLMFLDKLMGYVDSDMDTDVLFLFLLKSLIKAETAQPWYHW